jgi:hypothetical protein
VTVRGRRMVDRYARGRRSCDPSCCQIDKRHCCCPDPHPITGAAVNGRSSDKFSSGNRCRHHQETIKLAPRSSSLSNPDQLLGEEITLTQALSPAASNSAKRSASF